MRILLYLCTNFRILLEKTISRIRKYRYKLLNLFFYEKDLLSFHGTKYCAMRRG